MPLYKFYVPITFNCLVTDLCNLTEHMNILLWWHIGPSSCGARCLDMNSHVVKSLDKVMVVYLCLYNVSKKKIGDNKSLDVRPDGSKR